MATRKHKSFNILDMCVAVAEILLGGGEFGHFLSQRYPLL